MFSRSLAGTSIFVVPPRNSALTIRWSAATCAHCRTELGVRLAETSRTGVTLTAAGRDYHAVAAAVFADISVARSIRVRGGGRPLDTAAHHPAAVVADAEPRHCVHAPRGAGISPQDSRKHALG
jgi:hypothetical protein